MRARACLGYYGHYYSFGSPARRHSPVCFASDLARRRETIDGNSQFPSRSLLTFDSEGNAVLFYVIPRDSRRSCVYADVVPLDDSVKRVSQISEGRDHSENFVSGWLVHFAREI